MKDSTKKSEVEEMKRYSKLTRERILNNWKAENPGAFSSISAPDDLTFRHLIQHFKVNIVKHTFHYLEMDLHEIDYTLANTLRRVMIADVRTMAVEKVTIWQNNGVLYDELLAHRLGLIPIKVDPTLFHAKNPEDKYNPDNCLKFRLSKKCEWNKDSSLYKKHAKLNTLADLQVSCDDYNAIYLNHAVYSRDLEWVPLEGQDAKFKDPPRPVHDDILITRLRPGQMIELECYCELGRGHVHAKWSPVSTAWYKMQPEVRIDHANATDTEMLDIYKCCPMGVFDLVSDGKVVNPKKIKDIEDIADLNLGKVEVKANRLRNCTYCRECIRTPAREKLVDLLKDKTHFTFYVESTGIMDSADIFRQAIQHIQTKLLFYEREFEEENITYETKN